MKALGRHILVEFIGCSAEILNDVSAIENAMVDAAQTAGATVINSTFHHFSPFGVSGVVVIQESHLAIHTWPEFQYAAVDLFTCGDSVDPWISFDSLKRAFKAQTHSAIEMHRGSLSLLERAEFQTSSEVSSNQGKIRKEFKRNTWFTDRDQNQALSLRYDGNVLFNERSAFQTVRIYESCAYGKMLTIDNMIMCTERDEFHYHEMLVHPALQILKEPRKVLVIGGGDGGAIREILRYPSLEKVVMVEIDELVVTAAKGFMPSLSYQFDNPKLELHIDDGIKFLERCAEGEFDAIIMDGSDPCGPAEALFSQKFFGSCRRALKPKGILATQGASPMFQESAFQELNLTLKTVFGIDDTHVLLFHAPTYPSGMWSVQLGIKGNLHPHLNFDSDHAAIFCQNHGLRYYNEQLHLAAFCLPTFVRKLIQNQ